MKQEFVISQLSVAELHERLEGEKALLGKMKLNHAISPIENPNKITQSRKTIARLMTEIRKRELAELSK